MTDGLKTALAWLTSILLVFSAWTIQFRIESAAKALAIGIAGTLMIFCAEFIYTYRKRKQIKFGSVRNWLRIHITVGILGPLVILWHTDLNFHGFAGWLTILTLVVMMSGFTGRYIYRQVPRSIRGHQLTLKEVEANIAEIEEQLGSEFDESPRAARLVQMLKAEFPLLQRLSSATLGEQPQREADDNWRLMFRLNLESLRGRVRVRWLPPDGLRSLELRRLELVRRIRLLEISKRLLAKWRTMHIPLTLALFVGILIHMGGIFYYGRIIP